MKISFLGGSSFLFKNADATVVIDPTSDKPVGGKAVKADISVVTDPRYADAKMVEPASEGRVVYEISGQGEYEVKGVFIEAKAYHGKSVDKDKDLIVRIRMDGVHIVYLGYINKPLTKSEVEGFNTVDVLIVPVGGGKEFLTHENVDEVVSLADPGVFIPALYKEGGAHSGINELSSLDDYLKHRGTKNVESVSSLSVKSADFHHEDDNPMRIVSFS